MSRPIKIIFVVLLTLVLLPSCSIFDSGGSKSRSLSYGSTETDLTTGSTLKCTNNEWLNTASAKCVQCPSGSTANIANTSCVCSTGTFYPATNLCSTVSNTCSSTLWFNGQICQVCPTNSIPAPSVSATTCSCTMAQFNSSTNSCVPCSSTQYFNTATTSCVTCPTGTTVNSTQTGCDLTTTSTGTAVFNPSTGILVALSNLHDIYIDSPTNTSFNFPAACSTDPTFTVHTLYIKNNTNVALDITSLSLDPSNVNPYNYQGFVICNDAGAAGCGTYNAISPAISSTLATPYLVPANGTRTFRINLQRFFNLSPDYKFNNTHFRNEHCNCKSNIKNILNNRDGILSCY